MTDRPLLHPGKDELVAFGLGKLEPDEATKIEVHLGECEACCETLLDLKDDTFIELVRNSPEPRQSTNDADASVSSGKTGPASGVATDDAITAEAMPVKSGVACGPTDLPAQLENHPRYRLIELIGKGGMGDVYKAEHRLMDRPVALKLINQDLVKNTQAVERFRREFRAAARLRHPNIVTAHDAEQAGDGHFLVMEFVDGVDLASEVQIRGPLPIAEACDYIRQAADGLQHAHEKGMVHRDIKPHNLMLSADGQVRILDFGLANLATESVLTEADAADDDERTPAPLHLTTLGSVMGTPDYIAPEQARDAHAADIRADIYGLGCTLCYLLTGEAPFTAESLGDKLRAHEEHERPSLLGLREDVPPELADVVTRMMAKDPEDRFQAPADVAAALAPFSDQSETRRVRTATASRSDTQRARQSGRRRIRTFIAAMALLLLGAVVWITTDKGTFEIRSEFDDIEIIVSKGGEEFTVIDLKTDSRVRRLPSGDYEISLRGRSDLKLDKYGFTLKRWGNVSVSVALKPESVWPTEAGISHHDRLQGQRRTGILTNPPSVPTGGLPTGKNLIGDPSLENTQIGGLPQSWSPWLDDGPDFKCEVVEGGVTGKHCLQISGTGTRGVVFATSIPMDRTKRYALKGHVKVEGDAGAWAVVKLNYFNKTGWLGVDDRVGVKAGESGWHFFEKTDRSDAFPEATLMVPTCHIEGNGTAWFDDLEVVAYDRGKLPEDFDKRHGRNNRMYSLE